MVVVGEWGVRAGIPGRGERGPSHCSQVALEVSQNPSASTSRSRPPPGDSLGWDVACRELCVLSLGSCGWGGGKVWGLSF